MKTMLTTALLFFSIPVWATDVIPFSEAQRNALGIETMSIAVIQDRLGQRLPGKVAVPNDQLQVVTAPQEGLVASLLVAEGEEVQQGQTLLHIESPRLLALQGEYLEVRTRYQLARSTYLRDQQLSKEGIIAERRLLESRTQYQTLETSLARARRMLELSGMDDEDLKNLEASRKLSSSLRVKAPFSGVVLEQLITAGHRVEAADPLYRMARLDPLRLEIHVPLEQLGDTLVGQAIALSDVDIQGQVITVGRMVHGADQGVLVRAEISKGAEQLRPGQFVQVQLAVAVKASSYSVPKAAIVNSQGKSWVFVEHAEGFQPVSVTVLGEDAGQVIMKADLGAQSRIAASGSAAIKAAWLGGAE